MVSAKNVFLCNHLIIRFYQKKGGSTSVLVTVGSHVNTHDFTEVELGNITILSSIMILKCYNNRHQREFLRIVISSAQYYR